MLNNSYNMIIMVEKIRIWVRGARVYTLPIGIVPVAMAMVIAFRLLYVNKLITSHTLLLYCLESLLCMLVAVGMQVAVNYANDYCDGIRGLDDERSNRNQPLSSHLCDTSWRLRDAGIAPISVLRVCIGIALITCFVGLAAVALSGVWWLLLVGVSVLAAAWFYAGGSHPYGYVGWGELSAFVFFGPVSLLSSLCAILFATVPSVCHLQLASWWQVCYAVMFASIPGCYSSCLMMLNNIRDIAVDRAHGKMTFMACLGKSRALACASYVVLAWMIMLSIYIVLTLLSPSLIPTVWLPRGEKALFLTQWSAYRWGVSVFLIAMLGINLHNAVMLRSRIMQGDISHAFPMCVKCALMGLLVTIASLFAC